MNKTMSIKNWWGKTSWWIAGLVIFVIAILAIILLVNPKEKPNENTNGADPVAVATATGCNVPEGDTSSKPAMPKDLRWAAAKGITWPVSDTYGPTQDKDGYGTCFARSPLGAALAMTTFYGLGNTQDPNKVTEIYAIDSPGKTIALGKPSSSEDASAVGPMAFSGFSVDSFTPDEAQVTLIFALAKSPTGFMGLPSTLRWVDGDWKLKVLDDGSTFAGKPTTPVSGQFVTWGPSNG